jgi:CzcA family heavy metal efflux pump
MWFVRLALNRPYTFVILALLILVLSPVVISSTPADIFPNIDIPVIAVAWSYTALNPEELEGRLTTPYEKGLTSLVDNVEHVESTTYNGVVIVKIFFQPNSSLDTANAQVTAASQYMLRYLPPGTQSPEIINFSASSVPILQLGVSGKGISEQKLNDYSQNSIRPQLVTVPGALIPHPYGGKPRQMMVNMDQEQMQAKGVSPADILNAVNMQNLVIPSGTAKIGGMEYDVRANAAARSVEDLGAIPVKQVGATTIYVRDVATVSDGFQVQSNIVRQDGHRGVLVSVIKSGSASTLSVVAGIQRVLPRIAAIVPPELKIKALADQSIFVRGAIGGVVREAVIATVLTGLMILLFLASWRSALIIAISIPLSILTSIIILGMIHQTINIMTLGGLALAVGILVDGATVVIENIHRNLAMGKDLKQAILDGSEQVATPALVATLCICIVFLPMFMLSGVARYLFVPLAEAVVFAMLASLFLSRTLVPTLVMYMPDPDKHGHVASPGFFGRMSAAFEDGFERFRTAYHSFLEGVIARRNVFLPLFLIACLSPFFLAPWLGQDFFPNSDSGEFILHVRGRTGMQIEETARLCDLVEKSIRQVIPADEINNVLDNIGLPYSPRNTMQMTSGAVGASDADIMVSLREDHHPTANYVRALRKRLVNEFPKAMFYFLPADIVTQILNFGIPAQIDVQLEGNDVFASHDIADNILTQLRHVPGLTDLRVQQPLDYPTIDIAVNRTKAMQEGYTEHTIATQLLNTLSGSFQVTPMFFLNKDNAVNYNLVAQLPQYNMRSLVDLQNIPVGIGGSGAPDILGDIASINRSHEMASISHYNIRRVIDIFGSVQDRDLGAVSRDVQRIVDANRSSLPRGTFISVRGQAETMRSAYSGLVGGLGFAVILLYMLIVVNFQSWLDPFIIIMALPAALGGIILALFFTHTTLSVPALTGAIMCMGVATANSILVVAFAKERLQEHGNATLAAVEAGATRFRPVVMTALAMIIGMVPMALGLGDGGEQNAPLGRAVIGGLFCATIATLIFVPAVFSFLYRKKRAPQTAAARLDTPKPTRELSVEHA